MLRIWGRKTSVNVQKVMWATAELGLGHDRIDVGGWHDADEERDGYRGFATGRVPAPTTYPRDEPRQPCKRSCCWTPYGHTQRDGCTCHVTRDERADLIRRLTGGAT